MGVGLEFGLGLGLGLVKEAGTRSLSRGEVEYEQASCGVGA